MHHAHFNALDADLPGQEELNNDKLYITEEICEYWRATGQWTSRIAIIGFSGIGLLVLVILFSGILLPFSLPGAVFVLAAVFIFILFFLARNLYRYAVNIREAADFSEWAAMEKAFTSLCNAYTIYGLLLLLTTLALITGLAYWCIMLLPQLSTNL